MKTTKIGSEVIQKAFSMVSYDSTTGKTNKNGCLEKPKGSNIVFCGDPATKLNFSTLKNPDAWCQAFVSYLFAYGTDKLGIKNTFPMTAGVVDMYNRAKLIFKVDKVPFAGCIGFRRTGITTSKKNKDGTTASHSFIVYAVPDSNNILTIEGNSGDRVQLNGYSNTAGTFRISDHLFVHAELMHGGSSEVFHPLDFKPVSNPDVYLQNWQGDDGDKRGTGELLKIFTRKKEFK